MCLCLARIRIGKRRLSKHAEWQVWQDKHPSRMTELVQMTLLTNGGCGWSVAWIDKSPQAINRDKMQAFYQNSGQNNPFQKVEQTTFLIHAKWVYINARHLPFPILTGPRENATEDSSKMGVGSEWISFCTTVSISEMHLYSSLGAAICFISS